MSCCWNVSWSASGNFCWALRWSFCWSLRWSFCWSLHWNFCWSLRWSFCWALQLCWSFCWALCGSSGGNSEFILILINCIGLFWQLELFTINDVAVFNDDVFNGSRGISDFVGPVKLMIYCHGLYCRGLYSRGLSCLGALTITLDEETKAHQHCDDTFWLQFSSPLLGTCGEICTNNSIFKNG